MILSFVKNFLFDADAFLDKLLRQSASVSDGGVAQRKVFYDYVSIMMFTFTDWHIMARAKNFRKIYIFVFRYPCHPFCDHTCIRNPFLKLRLSHVNCQLRFHESGFAKRRLE